MCPEETRGPETPTGSTGMNLLIQQATDQCLLALGGRRSVFIKELDETCHRRAAQKTKALCQKVSVQLRGAGIPEHALMSCLMGPVGK